VLELSGGQVSDAYAVAGPAPAPSGRQWLPDAPRIYDDARLRFGLYSAGALYFGGFSHPDDISPNLNVYAFTLGPEAWLNAARAELGMRRFDSEAIVHRPHPRMIRRVFMLGLPIGLHMLAEISIFTLAGLLAGRIGTVPMAAHQVALQLAALTFMVPMGVAAATSVRVGRAIGAGEPERVRGAGMTGIAMGAAFMSISALAMWSFNDAFARVMTSDPAVLPLASELIVIAAAFQLFDGIQVVSAGALRGAGVTRWTMVANLIAYWIIAVPLVLILGFGMGFGPHGIWWGLTIGLATAAALLSAKFSVISRAPIVQLETV